MTRKNHMLGSKQLPAIQMEKNMDNEMETRMM